jgi:uracil-DNA glycosylase family 4
MKKPDEKCDLCPRLVRYRGELRREHPDWYNAPVPSIGSLNARVLVVGLAPGRAGSNRTGHPFVGDAAGDVLYPALIGAGFASGRYDINNLDNLRLKDCRVTNAVRCAVPDNKPLAKELRQCRTFLSSEIQAMGVLRCILALGHVAHRAVLDTFEISRGEHPFRHGGVHDLPDGKVLMDSYHCSRQNVATGCLTIPMFRQVISTLRTCVGSNDADLA